MKPEQRDTTKLTISKIVHELGVYWLVSKDHTNWPQTSQILILKAINKNSIAVEKQSFFLDKTTELLERYIELLNRLRLRGKSISVEETYGSTFNNPAPITETWSFRGAADIVVFEKDGAVIWDAKWSWSPEKLNQNQIALYATVHEIVLKQPVKQIGFIVFGPQKIVTFNFGKQQREETIEKMNSVTKKIIRNEFTPQPEETRCKYCDYAGYCKYKVEGDKANGDTGELEASRVVHNE